MFWRKKPKREKLGGFTLLALIIGVAILVAMHNTRLKRL